MLDPFGNMQNFLGGFQQFMNNPMQYMLQRQFQIPQNMMNDPNKIIQYLMNSGRLSQDQYNWGKYMSNQIQNNPQFKQFFDHK
jgi:hypothetical protein